MDAAEFETLLSDAETRLDRLKALYEQWFQGIERLEPTIARKDFERRIQALRREQPRNTAMRFRFQTLLQRYTTFQTYWGRVARQIEEGTYRRDVMRVRKKREDARMQRQADRGLARSEAPPPVDLDLDVEVDDSVDPELEAALAAIDAARAAKQAAAGRPTPPRVPLPPVPPVPRPSAGNGPPLPAPPPKTPSTPPRRGISPFAALGAARTAATVAAKPVPHAPAAPAPAAADESKRVATRAFGPPPGARPPSVGASPPPPRPPAPPIPSAGARPPAPPVPRPPAPRPAAPAAPRPPPPRPPADDGDDRIRRVYQQYIEARRKNNERTDVKFEAVAKSIREMDERMREKHRGKKIDFEIVVKDGKVGLKPVPK